MIAFTTAYYVLVVPETYEEQQQFLVDGDVGAISEMILRNADRKYKE